MWLPGFDYQRVDVEGVILNCAVAGSGPPLLMLHGYPQNHLTWRHVAPALAEDHTVVPTQYVLSNISLGVATINYHWFFLATGDGIPSA